MKRERKGALCMLLCAALLAGCAGTAGQEGAESASASEPAQTLEGTVLDITDESLIVRTSSGQEYVLKLDGDEVPPEAEILTGAHVTVTYDGVLSGIGKNVDVLRVEASEAETVEDASTASTVDGWVTKESGDTVTLCAASGTEYTFSIAQAARRLDGRLTEGDWVRVTFDGDAGDVQNTRVREIAHAERTQDCYWLRAEVRRYDPDEDVLTVRTMAREERTMDLAHTQVEMAEPFEPGQDVDIAFFWGAGEEDGVREIRPVRVVDAGARDTEFYAVVEAYDEDSGALLLHMADGRVLDTWITQKLEPKDGLDKNDGVWVRYTGWFEGADLSTMKITNAETQDKGLDNESSAAGAVRAISEDGFTLACTDGRTLRFTQLAAAQSLPESIAVGDDVRVYYTGWTGSEDDAEDTQHAEAAHVTRILR